ncbi:MAG: restriction endonuclease [Candidatus Saccharibacteria bacterium]|nr:restriction endonuclease [Microbacteriaceae bacterium]
MREILVSPTFLPDWQAAEIAAVDHMKVLGFIDAQPTRAGADGGIDAQGSEAAAQVKFYANPVGRPEIQRLRGAAPGYKLALFYSTGGYTKEALAYANEADVALFLMDLYGRCEPTSDLASLLIEPQAVQERKSKLEELQIIRYGFAASALETDLEFFVRFAFDFDLKPEVSSLYSYVVSDLQARIPAFRVAIESRQFDAAAVIFEEIQNRTMFLRWSTSAEPAAYANIEEAIAEGWKRDATQGSDHLLQKAAAGVLELQNFLVISLEGWNQSFPDIANANQLMSFATVDFAGMLGIASLDASVLSPELLKQLKKSVRAGVKKGILAGSKAFESVLDLHLKMGVKPPSSVIAKKLRAESIAARICLQLDSSRA